MCTFILHYLHFSWKEVSTSIQCLQIPLIFDILIKMASNSFIINIDHVLMTAFNVSFFLTESALN